MIEWNILKEVRGDGPWPVVGTVEAVTYGEALIKYVEKDTGEALIYKDGSWQTKSGHRIVAKRGKHE